MDALQYLNNIILNFKYCTNTKLYKIQYLILEQHYFLDKAILGAYRPQVNMCLI